MYFMNLIAKSVITRASAELFMCMVNSLFYLWTLEQHNLCCY